MSNVGPKKRKPGKNSIGIRRFVDDEFDSWVRPWIQAVKCVPEYAAEWDALAAKCSATNFSAGASLARATFGNRLPPKPEPSRSLWHLAVRWKLPTGPVSPSALDDFGAELDGDLIRQYRLWQRPETAAREVNFYQCVDELAPIFKKFENEFDGPEERRRAELALVATLFVMQTGGQPPL